MFNKPITAWSILSLLILISYFVYPYQNISIAIKFLKPYYFIFIILLSTLIIIFSKQEIKYGGLQISLLFVPFLLYLVVSIIYSVDQYYSLYMASKYIVYFFIAIVISVSMINIENLWKKILWAIVFSSTIVSILYIYKFILYGLPMLHNGASMQTIGELSSINIGFGGGRNLMASWLSFTITFPIMYLWLKSNAKQRIFLLLISIILFTAIILSLSRTSILSIFAFLFIFYFISDNYLIKKNIRRTFLLIFLFIFLILLFNPFGFGDFLTQRFLRTLGMIDQDIVDYGASGRKELWMYAWKSIQEYPLLGSGIGSLYHGMSVIGGVHNYHNLFIQFFAQLGVLGLFLFVFWTFALFFFSYKSIKTLMHTRYALLSKIVFVNLLVYYFKGMLMFQYTDMEIWTIIPFIIFLTHIHSKASVNTINKKVLL